MQSASRPCSEPSRRTEGSSASDSRRRLFRRLKPLEQRLAVYLAKMFVSQSTHRRYVDELAAALPIQVAQPKHLRVHGEARRRGPSAGNECQS